MSFCKQCGTKLEQDAKFCPTCGTATQQISDNNASFTPPVVPTAETGKNKDAEDNKIMGILAYIGLLVLVPIFAAKQSKFARFHANQGLVLLICEAVYGVLYMILSALVLAISWRLYFVITILGFLSFAFVIFSILGLINAVKGEEKELPLIGKIRILK